MTDWTLAACASADPEAWFPGKGSAAGAAKRVCAGCPIRVKCAQTAIDNPSLEGLWGGLGTKERQDIRAGRRAA